MCQTQARGPNLVQNVITIGPQDHITVHYSWPRFMLYLVFQISFLVCLKYHYFVVQDSLFKQN